MICILALGLTACASQPSAGGSTGQTESETVTDEEPVTEETVTVPPTEKPTEKQTEAAEENETSETLPERFIDCDLSSAELLITDNIVYPMVYEPSEEDREAIIKALGSTPQKEHDHSGGDFTKIQSRVYVKAGDRTFIADVMNNNGLFTTEDVGYDFCYADDSTYSAICSALDHARENRGELFNYWLYDSNGNADPGAVWQKQKVEPGTAQNACPLGDFSGAIACIRDVGIYPGLWVLSEEQTKMLSDMYNSFEWQILPDDTESSIDFSLELFINDNGRMTSLEYIGDRLFVWRNGSETRKYRAPQYSSSLLSILLESTHFTPSRMISIISQESEPDYRDQEYIWDKVLPQIVEIGMR